MTNDAYFLQTRVTDHRTELLAAAAVARQGRLTRAWRRARRAERPPAAPAAVRERVGVG